MGLCKTIVKVILVLVAVVAAWLVYGTLTARPWPALAPVPRPDHIEPCFPGRPQTVLVDGYVQVNAFGPDIFLNFKGRMSWSADRSIGKDFWHLERNYSAYITTIQDELWEYTTTALTNVTYCVMLPHPSVAWWSPYFTSGSRPYLTNNATQMNNHTGWMDMGEVMVGDTPTRKHVFIYQLQKFPPMPTTYLRSTQSVYLDQDRTIVLYSINITYVTGRGHTILAYWHMPVVEVQPIDESAFIPAPQCTEPIPPIPAAKHDL